LTQINNEIYRLTLKGVIKNYVPLLYRAVGSTHLVATGFNPLIKRNKPVPRVLYLPCGGTIHI
jgi:hypothetical protein